MTSYLDILKSLQQSSTQSSFTNPNLQNQYINSTLYNDIYQPYTTQNFQHQKQSFIQYVPFKRKIIDFTQRVYKQKIPKTRIIIDQINKIYLQKVPRQRIETDYYAVQHLRYYQKQYIPEKTIQYVPVLKTIKKTQFIPVQRQIVHYPKDIDPNIIKNNSQINISDSNQEKSPLSRFKNIIHTNLIDKTSEQRNISPINQYKSQQVEDQVNENVTTSILASLSKAYDREESTTNGQKLSQYNVTSQAISQFDFLSNRPATLGEINYKSTQTIDSKYLYNL